MMFNESTHDYNVLKFGNEDGTIVVKPKSTEVHIYNKTDIDSYENITTT